MDPVQLQQQLLRATRFCRRCNQPSHWDALCPMNPLTNRWLDTSVQLIAMRCPCSAGLCEVKVLSGGSRHPNPRYFCCLAKRERYCGYFKWCDEAKKEAPIEIDINPFEEIYAQDDDSSASR